MKPLNILIAEDEFPIALDLKLRLEKMGAIVTGIAANYEEVFSRMAEKPANLVLMDINMPGTKNGIDAAGLLAERYNIPVIFITAFSDNSTVEQAMRSKPFGYIVKPVTDLALQTQITIAWDKFQQLEANKAEEVSIVSDNVFIKHKGELVNLPVNDIVLLEAVDNYTRLHTAAQKYLLSSVLKVIHQQLSPASFLRVHKSYVVHKLFIKSVGEDSLLLQHIPDPIPIGKAYRADFLEQLQILR